MLQENSYFRNIRSIITVMKHLECRCVAKYKRNLFSEVCWDRLFCLPRIDPYKISIQMKEKNKEVFMTERY